MGCHGWILTLDIFQKINDHFPDEGFQAASIINFKVVLQVHNTLEEQDPVSLSILSDTSSLWKTYNHEILHGELINEEINE